jgi:hypothetical protein
MLSPKHGPWAPEFWLHETQSSQRSQVPRSDGQFSGALLMGCLHGLFDGLVDGSFEWALQWAPLTGTLMVSLSRWATRISPTHIPKCNRMEASHMLQGQRLVGQLARVARGTDRHNHIVSPRSGLTMIRTSE